MGLFCKIIELKDGTEQVLVRKIGYNEEKDRYQIVLTTNYTHPELWVNVDMTLSYEEEEKCNEMFEKIDKEKVEKFRNEMDGRMEEVFASIDKELDEEE